MFHVLVNKSKESVRNTHTHNPRSGSQHILLEKDFSFVFGIIGVFCALSM